MRLTSSAFQPGKPIPATYTCKGKDCSPALAIHDVPAGTKALALIMDDPDAPVGLWTHWTVWDLPATTTTISEGADITALGGIEGTTTAKTIGWHGPCPPSGTHRYFFRAYALDAKLGLPRGAPIETVKAAIKAHSIATAELMGTFAHR